ncbi:hypothetical protein HUJ05_001706 [Dendroctonus ponderosae]|nr:hypothetical protein HUJ05_001706 [Dendroctonus ponderosae]
MLVNRNMVRLLCLMICFAGAIESIHVAVYYEALCSDSVYFITRQLYPNYQLFKDHMTVEFIPYGKAIIRSKNSVSYDCLRGIVVGFPEFPFLPLSFSCRKFYVIF